MIKERQVEQTMNVLLNKKGFSLVEVMIALVVVLVVFLALMQTALVGIDSNMRNILRDEAVSIAEMRVNEDARNIPFTSIVSDPNSLSAGGCASADCPTGFSATGVCVPKDVRSISGFKFCTNLACTEFGGDGNCATDDADNKQVNITIGWKWKGDSYTHNMTTIMKR